MPSGLGKSGFPTTNTTKGISPTLHARLVQLTGRLAGRQMVFQYNPEGFTDSVGVEYAEISIPGGLDLMYQFSTVGAREFSFQLMFNDIGVRTSRKNSTGTVEQSIRFLQSLMEPEEVLVEKFSFQAAPPILLFLWGQLKFDGVKPGLECIMTSLNVQRLLFKPRTSEASRALCDITLRRFKAGTV